MKREDEGDSSKVRIVARIIDPSVREDGFGEPVFVPTPRRSSAGGGVRNNTPGSHPVRDRLIAKARAAEAARTSIALEPEPESDPAPPPVEASSVVPAPEPDRVAERLGFSSQPEILDDLDLIGAPERPRAPPAAQSRPLGAPTALLLGTLAGMALLVTGFALLIQFAPREPLGSRPAPAPSEEQTAAAAPALTDETEPEAPVSRVTRPNRKRIPGPWRIANALEAGDEGARAIEGTIGNRSFLDAVQAEGVSLREGYRVITALDGLKDLDRCRPRDRFEVLLDSASGRLRAFEYTVSDEEVYQAREGPDGRLTGTRLDLQVRRERSQGVLIVRGTFEDSAIAAGFEPGLASVVNKALAGYSSVGEMRDGDVLGLVVQEVSVLGEFSRYAGVEALEYRTRGAEPLRIYYHQSGKSRGYVDSKGRVFGKSRWARPVPGAAVTSRFNPRRRHPILKVIKPHNGTDFGAPTGTPVLASAAGRVTFVGEAGPNGNFVSVRHPGGYETGYSHLSRFAKGLKVGSRVEQKQLVGYVGSTGRSTGPHLHFSAKKNGRFIDPESLNLDAFARIAVSDKQVLSELRGRYDRLLNALNIPEPRALDRAPALAELDGTILATARGGNTAKASLDVRSLSLQAHAPAANPAVALAPIYLTDRELLRAQPAVHDGEVDP